MDGTSVKSPQISTGGNFRQFTVIVPVEQVFFAFLLFLWSRKQHSRRAACCVPDSRIKSGDGPLPKLKTAILQALLLMLRPRCCGAPLR
jgi:hypothetical protein